MNTRWFVAKYIPDLRRGEPVNVGVILTTPTETLYRFLGVTDRGVDGRRIPKDVKSHDNFRAWVAYWTELAGYPDRIVAEAARRSAGANYILQEGGRAERSDRSPQELIEHLFAAVVRRTESTSPRPAKASEIFQRLQIVVERGVVETVQTLERYADNTPVEDKVYFDFRYRNATTIRMREFAVSDQPKSWDRVHAAHYAFAKAKSLGGDLLALLHPRRDAEAKVLRDQMKLLEREAQVIDLSQPHADRRVAEALHLPRS
jgi:hypothetical protein